MIWWILFGLHCAICGLIIILQKRRMIKTTDLIVPIVAFVPIWGLFAFILQELFFDEKKQGANKIEIHKRQQLDLKFRQINIEKNAEHNATVPLEEAIQINDAKTRRTLMLEVLHGKKSEYLWMLQRASSSNDVEITHYATTTIMEIQSEYEKKIHEYDNMLLKDSDNKELILEYVEFLSDYIDSGLLSGNVLLIIRKQLDELLQKILYSTYRDKHICFMAIDNKLELKQFKKAGELLREAKYRWPDDEKVYMLYVSYYWHLEDGQEIQKILRHIKNSNLYLSQEGKAWFQFWYKGETQ
ncbi:MAG: hypothetical protein PHG19_04860 [Anaerotignum sp.]|nr:hypothetical protein [Anaerotignum sp.]